MREEDLADSNQRKRQFHLYGQVQPEVRVQFWNTRPE
jgi:hypothetical protein